MKKAAYIIATQYNNLGDLVINKCLIDELSKYVELYIDTNNVSTEFLQNILKNDQIKTLEEHYRFSFKNWSILKYFIFLKKRFKYVFKSPGPMVYTSSGGIMGKIKGGIIESIFKVNKSAGGKSFVIGCERLKSEAMGNGGNCIAWVGSSTTSSRKRSPKFSHR